jgi:phenylpropionate dioxygenase-like ring-hydroxylating dioxygenase large terminal subunit
MTDQQTSAAPTRRSHDPEVRPIMRFSSGTLHENWYIAARSKDVGNKRPLASTIMEEKVALWRTGRGDVAAVVDRCLHRNAALTAGRINDGCITCPYHGWSYGSDGLCSFVPSEGNDFRPRPDRRLETFPVAEQDGFVWVYMGTPARAGGRRPFAFPPVGDGWNSYTMVTRFAGDVTDLVENFMDVPHTAFVHSGWFRKAHNAKPAEAIVERMHDAVHVEYFQPDDSIGFTRRMLNPDNAPMTHTDRFFMPNVTRVDYGWGSRRGFIITSQITPVTPREAIVYTAITFRFGAVNRLARRLLPAYTRIVINQDVKIMDVQTATITRFGERRFHGTGADVIHRSIEALRDYSKEGERGTPPRPATKRIRFWM